MSDSACRSSHGAVVRQGNTQPGETTHVQGVAGGIGLAAVEIEKVQGGLSQYRRGVIVTFQLHHPM